LVRIGARVNTPQSIEPAGEEPHPLGAIVVTYSNNERLAELSEPLHQLRSFYEPVDRTTPVTRAWELGGDFTGIVAGKSQRLKVHWKDFSARLVAQVSVALAIVEWHWE
jgi:hypothetical protein